MKRTFIVGDIHGCVKTFRELIYDRCGITYKDRLFLLGDYIDRGPDSKFVIDEILNLIRLGYDVYPLMGNHEYMLIKSIESDKSLSQWHYNGSESTLNSFNISHPSELHQSYIDFFTSLKYYYALEQFIIVHGGLNFALDNPFDDYEAMVWERNRTEDLIKTGGRRLIVGHTPVPVDRIITSVNEDIIHLDGGCVYAGIHSGLGTLAALELTQMKLFLLENIDY